MKSSPESEEPEKPNMSRKQVIMLLDNPFESDMRVEKEATSLADAGFDVTVYATRGSLDIPLSEHRNGFTILREVPEAINQPPLPQQIKTMKVFAKKIISRAPSILHYHDFRFSFIGAFVKSSAPNIFVTYDSHEYLVGWPFYKELAGAFNRFKGYLVWLMLCRNERKYASQIDALIGPSDEIVQRLRQRLKFKGTSIAVRNIPQLTAGNPDVFDIRSKHDLQPDTNLVVLSGNIYMSIEQFSAYAHQVLKILDTALVIIGNRAIHKRLQTKYASEPRMIFLDYDSSTLHALLAQCDIGLAHTQATKYEAHRIGSSNRLMEYTIAALPVVGTQQVSHQLMAERYGHIVMFRDRDMQHFAEALDRALKNLKVLKEKAHRAATALDWNSEFRPVIDCYREV